MRKVLSLKKAAHSGPPKNQKSITQFFKNTNYPSTLNHQKSPVKDQSCQNNELDKKDTKRKASSPVLLETVELSDEDNTNGDTSHPVAQKNKKFKSDHDATLPKSPKKSIAKQKTPEKENNINKQIFTHSNSNLKSLPYSDKDNENKEGNERLPLTPIKSIINGESNNVDRLSSNRELDLKSSALAIENHVRIIETKSTSKTVLNSDVFSQNDGCSNKINKTPRKSPGKGLHYSSRVALLETPEKLSQEELSPSKNGSTEKTLEFSPSALDEFGDQWDMEALDEHVAEDLDLSTVQRCEVVLVTQHQGQLELRLKNSSNHRGTCYIEGVWLDTPLCPGETISVLAARNPSGRWCVGNSAGLLVARPDHLVSSTSVVGAVFCRRKAVLQERFRGLDSGNTAMTMGILIHELVQKALTENIMDIAKLRIESERIIKDSIQTLYDAGLSEEEASTNMSQYLPPLAEFMQTYVAKSPLNKQPQKDQWAGHVDKVLDIEENLCCPQLGLKGKIDATLQVTIHRRNGGQRSVVPLELKSGRASESAEHRGQLVLYGMMLALLRGDDPSTADASGLLLYLKERVSVRSVSCGYPERRDLMLLRNQIAQYLAAPLPIDPEELCDIEEAACALQQRLPEPVHHHNACASCPYLTICSLHLWHTDGPSVSESHPLTKLREKALDHLTPTHIEYFLQWTALLRVEESGQMRAAPLHALWTDSADKRSKRGTCAANLKLKSVVTSNDRYLHYFERQIKEIDTLSANSNTSGPQEGDFSIVGVAGRPWVAAGVVALANEKQIHILLERDLSRRLNSETVFHVDTYESYATTVQNLTNLGVLIEDSERSARLRRLIIDKASPEFEKKLPREVGRLGSKLMRSLNIEQQRAVLRALSAKDYALLQGLPGTGKTQTISVLIQMLVGLKQRVLVTAHTHSAVDTVLSRLPDTLKVMRLGSSSRVAVNLKDRCEDEIIRKCKDVKELAELYASMEVVGVTCLGASHAMLSKTRFDVCIVDEATQVLQSTVLRPLLAARRALLVGDPDQLPPVVRSRAARRLGMEESLFHRLMSSEATSTLQLQYRMNQQLVDVANKVAYRDKLKCADQQVAQAKLNIDVKKISDEPSWLQSACCPERAALFLDAPSLEIREGKSCTNVAEACVITAIVEAMIKGGVNATDIGVIAPFRDQVALLRRVLVPRGVTCSTVDQFQGRDKPVILYSCTKSDGQDDTKVKDGEILNDQRRLAVSVTRAKHKLVVVGNTLALQRYMPLQRLIEACEKVPLNKHDIDSVLDKYKKIFL